LLTENKRLQDEVEATRKQAAAAQARVENRLEGQEQENRKMSAALNAAERRAEDAERERARGNEQIGKLQGETRDLTAGLNRVQLRLRVTAAAAIVVLGLLMVFAATVLPWPWLDNHPYKIGLYIAAFLLICATAWVAFYFKRWPYILVAVMLTVIVAVIPIIDGAV